MDFYITGVRYTNDAASIKDVKIALRNTPITGEATVEAERIVPSAFIRDLLRTKKLVIYTATFNKTKNKWEAGSEVSLYGDGFISTDPNSKTKDNLGELPEF